MKKTKLLLLTFLTIITFIPFVVFASSLNFTENTIIEKNEYGLSYKKVNGTVTNDFGTTSNQNINIFTKSDDLMVVNWSKTDHSKLINDSTLGIALDFEENNHDFEVIAGVNGDYFSSTTINSNVIYGGKVLNPNNHNKYNSLEFLSSGEKIANHKNNFSDNYYTLSVYDIEKLKYLVRVDKINSNFLLKGETTIVFNDTNHVYSEDITYYDLSYKTNFTLGSHYYHESIISTKTTNIKNKLVLATKDDELIKNINMGDNIVVQKELTNIMPNSMMIGYGSNILNNNIIPSFEEIKDQSLEFAKTRHPRTGFGFDKNGNFNLITVDGRLAGGSQGVNLREFAKIMQQYDFVEGYNLDGGGSTQAIYKTENGLDYVNNIVYDGNDIRKVSNALLFVRKKESIPKVIITNQNNILTINNENNNNVTKLEVFENNKLTKTITSKDVINYEYNLDGFKAISVVATYVVDGKTKRAEVYNTKVKADKIIVNAEVDISTNYNNNNLTVTISYNDPDQTIDSIRVKVPSLNLDKPALIKNSQAREATFNNVESINEIELEVLVKYKNKEEIIKNIILEDNNLKEDNINEVNNKPTIIIIITILIVIMIVLTTFFVVKRKRLQKL